MVLYNIIYPKKKIGTYPFSCVVPLVIILQFICSYFILTIHFYKLQYLTLFLNLGIFIAIFIFDLINIIKYESFDGKVLLFYALNIIFFSVEYSYGKKILLYGFISIYSLLIIRGLIVVIFLILLSLIILIIKKEIFTEIGIFFMKIITIPFVIGSVFSNFFLSLFLWLIIDRFSPNYFPLGLVFYEIFYIIMTNITDIKKDIHRWDLYLRIILYLVSTIGVIIHSEMVVINICNLGSDTKYFLDLKVESEEQFANTDNPLIMQRYESFVERPIKNDDNSNSLKSEEETELDN